MWLYFFCASMFINIFLAFYIRWLFKAFDNINQEIVSVVEKINDFSGHLAAVHEMEMFYGDETLQSLLTHASELKNELLDLDLIINEDEEVIEALNEE